MDISDGEAAAPQDDPSALPAELSELLALADDCDMDDYWVRPSDGPEYWDMAAIREDLALTKKS
jgi:hypothetical protein